MSNVKKNFAYQSIYQVANIILPLVTSPYVARVLGAKGVGVYSYTYAIAYYFSLVALLGIANHGNRIIAGVRDNKKKLTKTFSELLLVHCIIAFMAVVAYYIYFLFFVKEDYLSAFIQGIWVLASFFDVSWFFFGLEKFKLTVTINLIVKFVTTICVFLFVHQPQDIWLYCLIMATGSLFSQLALWSYIRQYFSFRLVTWQGMRTHIMPLLTLFIPAIAVSLYKYMDKIMLGLLTTKAQVGFFENAERAINIPISVIASFGTVMLPKMSNLVTKGDTERERLYIGLSMEFIMCLTSAMSFGIFAVAHNFAVVFWGDEFIASGNLIQALSISIIFVAFANIIRMQYLIPKRLDVPYIISIFAGAVINLVTNALLISRFAALGAAVGTAVAEFTVCAVQAFYVRKQLDIKQYISKTLLFCAFGLLMATIVSLVGEFIPSRTVGLLMQIIVGAVVYSICSLFYFRKTQNKYIRSFIEKVGKRFLKS